MTIEQENTALRELIRCLDSLLACYRTKKQPSDSLLDRTIELRQQLNPVEKPNDS